MQNIQPIAKGKWSKTKNFQLKPYNNSYWNRTRLEGSTRETDDPDPKLVQVGN